MKKFIVLLTVAAMSFGVFSGCGSKEQESQETVAENERVTFTVGFDAEFPP